MVSKVFRVDCRIVNHDLLYGRIAEVKLKLIAEGYSVWHRNLLSALQSSILLHGTNEVKSHICPFRNGIRCKVQRVEPYFIRTIVIRLMVERRQLCSLGSRMGKRQGDDADGNAQHRYHGLQLVLHEIANCNLKVVNQ